MYFLGVDSGGTKTAFLLIDENGVIHARHRSGSGGFFDKGREGLRELITDGITAISKMAGITKDDIAFAGLGFPGYGEKEGSKEAIFRACSEAISPDRVICECDCYLGWAGSFAMEPGINIISGTGSNCYGVNEYGQSARSSGWGAYCDEGSCRWIGSRLIQVFTKQSDGRMPRTKLYDMFRSHFQIEDDAHFIYFLNHELAKNNSETAKLQMLLKKMYEAEDPHAANIYKEAADELSKAVFAVAVKLGWQGKRFIVSYSGGLFRSGECVLAPLRETVAKFGGELQNPRYTPEQGACLFAMRAYNPRMNFNEFVFQEKK